MVIEALDFLSVIISFSAFPLGDTHTHKHTHTQGLDDVKQGSCCRRRMIRDTSGPAPGMTAELDWDTDPALVPIPKEDPKPFLVRRRVWSF